MALILIYIVIAIGRIFISFLCATTIYGAFIGYKDVRTTLAGKLIFLFLGALAIICFIIAMGV